MPGGKKTGKATGTTTEIYPPSDGPCWHRIRLETSSGFNGTVTFKQKPIPGADGSDNLTSIACFYKKVADGLVASTPFTPGPNSKLEYMVDGTAGVTCVDISGGGGGTLDIYWSSVPG